MQFFQAMKLAAKSGNSVTLGTNPVGFGDGEGHPKYLGIASAVITTTLATADATFWGCPGMFRIEISRAT
jgi:hypothetical protein